MLMIVYVFSFLQATPLINQDPCYFRFDSPLLVITRPLKWENGVPEGLFYGDCCRDPFRHSLMSTRFVQGARRHDCSFDDVEEFLT